MKDNIKNIATQIIKKEVNGLEALFSVIDDDFVNVIDYIIKNETRIVVTGVGKSAIIGQKFVATLNSTGTNSQFMNASDAMHGDLGIIRRSDLVIAISKSGNSEELKRVIPFIRQKSSKIVAIVSNRNSYLAHHADFVLYVPIKEEACYNNLAPSTSTTAHLVLCDAIALTLAQVNGFTTEDFARTHPGGSLGKKLFMRVGDVFDPNNRPFVRETDDVRTLISNISNHRLGATVVLGKDEEIKGIITDGDIRRMLQSEKDLALIRAQDVMTSTPKVIDIGMLAVDAFKMMESHKITSLIVLENGKYVGIIHIHDIIKEGIN